MDACTRNQSTVPGRAAPRRHASSWALTIGGLALVGIGLYFIFFRPPLLPEDLRYIGATSEQIKATFPELLDWLSKVFAVMGGYITSMGVLTCYLAWTNLRTRTPGVLAVVWLTAVISVGVMVLVNFAIQSDFRWMLLLLPMPWIAASFLFCEIDEPGDNTTS